MASMPEPRRGERRRQRTRSAILTAGQQLFAERAMEGVTVDEIVAAANVAKGSFYNHFDDKEGLASAIVELVQGDCEFHVFAANRAIDDPAARMARALCVMIAYARAHPDRLQAMLSLSQRRTEPRAPLNAGVVGDLEDGLAKGRFAGVTLETGLLIVMGIISITVLHSIDNPSAVAIDSLAATVGGGLLRALGVPDGEAGDLARAAARDLLKEAKP